MGIYFLDEEPPGERRERQAHMCYLIPKAQGWREEQLWGQHYPVCCGTRVGGLPRADEMVANGHPGSWRGRTLGSVAHDWFSFLLSRRVFPSGFPPMIKSSNHPRLKFCQAVSPFPVFPISRSSGLLHALLKCTSHPAPSRHSPLDGCCASHYPPHRGQYTFWSTEDDFWVFQVVQW